MTIAVDLGRKATKQTNKNKNLSVFLKLEGIKHIKRDFRSDAWPCPRVGLVARVVHRGSKCIFFEHGHLAYQIDGDNERNRIQVKLPP